MLLAALHSRSRVGEADGVTLISSSLLCARISVVAGAVVVTVLVAAGGGGAFVAAPSLDAEVVEVSVATGAATRLSN